MDVLADKETDKLPTYANKSAEIKNDCTITANINSTHHKLSKLTLKAVKTVFMKESQIYQVKQLNVGFVQMIID